MTNMREESSYKHTVNDILSSPPWSPISSVPELSDVESVSEGDPRSPITPASGVRFEDQVWVRYQDSEEGCQSPASLSSKRTARSAHSPRANVRSHGTVSFIVKDAEHLQEVDCVLFKNLSDRWTQAIEAGVANDEPVSLVEDINKEEFDILYSVLSNKGQFGDKDLTFDECLALLSISILSLWALGTLEAAASSRLDTLLKDSPAQRIELGHRFNRSDWVNQGLGELCVRKDAPNLAEADRLKNTDMLLLTRIRHLCDATESDNTDFHQTFPKIPGQERLLALYGCGYNMRRGRMYVTKCHVCFYSIFGGMPVTIRLEDIKAVEKCYTAGLFPTAVDIQTAEQDFHFIAFFSRNEAFELLTSLREFANLRV